MGVKGSSNLVVTHNMSRNGDAVSITASSIDHLRIVCLVGWPMNESEAGVDLVLIESSLLFLYKFLLISMRAASLA